ncbi:MAG: 4Fe-4S dicluster domain-containing protein [Chromatiales bacterium]|jgi:molybdopterin-containing oxidoreductase family iron-sulfur binding subunit|nr:4Fe-4S dicluster domain-containing protein [Chromatiales bacterium]MDX9766200.1 4Fe-4S dicluster domain-containing protein [Ectothiorhodospiraceae bacterium]
MSNESKPDLSRRQFLGGAAAVAGLAVAPGVFLVESASAATGASSKVRWGLLIDTNLCDSGCDACVTACNKEHGLNGHGRPATDAQYIRKVDLKDRKTGATRSLPVMCQHCEHPPCVDVCPTGASMKRPDGIVLVDKHICIGCRYCMMACPYKARSFVHEDLTDQLPHTPRGKGTVESCNLCVHRIDRGDGTTACVEACNRDGGSAMVFGDLNDPNSEISRRLAEFGSAAIRADFKLNPGVRYRGI